MAPLYGYGCYDFLGWDLDDVLEGAEPVPVTDPVDRAGQFVALPALTDDERQAEIRAQQAREFEIRRSCALAVEVLDRYGKIDRGERVVMLSERYQSSFARRKQTAEQRVREAIARHLAARAA